MCVCTVVQPDNVRAVADIGKTVTLQSIFSFDLSLNLLLKMFLFKTANSAEATARRRQRDSYHQYRTRGREKAEFMRTKQTFTP